MLDLLPPLICFNVSEAELAALQSTLQLLEKEITAPAAGTATMLDSLADIFFIQTLRAYLLNDSTRNTGWTGVLSDERLGKAIRLMHKESEKPWTIISLADHIGMSRAAYHTWVGITICQKAYPDIDPQESILNSSAVDFD